MARVYGTGHTILLTYTTAGTALVGTHGVRAPVDATGPADPQLTVQLWDGPTPRMSADVRTVLGAPAHDGAGLTFLVGRPLPIG